MIGVVHEVNEELLGTQLSEAATAGDEWLNVYSTLTFSEISGSLNIGGSVVEYLGVDNDLHQIFLVNPLPSSFSEDAFLYPLPEARIKVAMVDASGDDEGDSILAAVPQTLYDKLKIGIRTEDEREVANLDLVNGRWTITDIQNRAAVVLQENLEPPTDGLPPATSPIATPIAGLDAIFVTWTSVVQDDPVLYDVAMSTVAGADPDTVVAYPGISGNTIMVSAFPSGTALSTSAPTYFWVRATDADGVGPWSTRVNATAIEGVDMGYLTTHLGDLQTELDDLTDDLTDLDTALSGLSTDLSDAEADLATAAGDITALQGRFPITTPDIAANAVTGVKVAALAIDTAQIAANAITTAKIVTDAVTAAQIAANAVGSSEIAAGAVIAGKIFAGSIVANDIAANTITAAKIAALTITASEIAANTITAAKVAADTLTANEIAANAITVNELAANSVNASKIVANSITASQIAANTITASQILAGTITATELGALSVTTAKLAAGAVVAAKITAGTITATEIATDTITAIQIAANAITASEINAGAVTTAKIFAGAVTTNEILSGTILATNIASSTITATQIAANTITAAKIFAGTITTTEIAANTITAANIATGTITANEIAAGTITTAKLNASAINGMTITGAVVQTASSGERMIMRNDGGGGIIESFSGVANEVLPTTIDPDPPLAGLPGLVIKSGTTTIYNEQAQMLVVSGTAGTSIAGLIGGTAQITAKDASSQVSVQGGGGVNILGSSVSFDNAVVVTGHPSFVGTAWQTLPLQTNFIAFGGGFQTPQYKRVGYRVDVRGLIGRTTSTAIAGFTAAVLPTGARPPSSVMFEQHVSGARCRVDVNNVGFIICQDQALAVGGYLSVDSISLETL